MTAGSAIGNFVRKYQGLARFGVPVAGVILTLACTYVFSRHELRIKKQEFDTACQDRVAAVRRELLTNLRLLQAIESFSDSPDRRVSDLYRFASGLGETGNSGRFYIWNPAKSPSAVPLSSYPLEPQTFHLEDGRIERAIRESEMRGPVSFVAPGGLVITAVGLGTKRNSAVEGLVSAYRMIDVVRDGFAGVRPIGLNIWIETNVGGAAPVLVHLYKSRRILTPYPLREFFQPDPQQWEHRERIDLAGLDLTLRCRPIPYFLDRRHFAPHLCLLLAGLVSTFALSRLAENRIREFARVGRLVRKRSRQLLHVRDQLKSESVERQKAQDRFQQAFLDSAVGMAVVDRNYTFVAVNRATCEMLGYTENEIVGRSSLLALPESERAASLARLEALFAKESRSYITERTVICKGGATKWIRCSISLVETADEPLQLVSTFEDITDRMEARRLLLFEASHDSLTSLPNRRSFDQSLSNAIEFSSGGRIALLYLDLDGFKFVNDSLGHTLGDKLLRQVAHRLEERVGTSGITARVGGDEFTIVVPQIGDRQAAATVAADIIASLQQPFFVDGQELFLDSSIGIGLFPDDAREKDALLQCADTAMYEAKRRGKGCFQFFTGEIRELSLYRLKVENALRHALDREELTLVYQPIFSSRHRKIVRFEALCRWSSKELGPVSPDRFIPVAEETGLIVPIGRWVLEQACLHAARWNQAAPDPVQIAVNVSTVQFARPGFVEEVVAVLAQTGLRPELLEIELTESVVARDIDETVRKMRQLRNIGVTIAIDDFGTGFSSLSYLQRMPVDCLKIDRSFLARIDENEDAGRILSSMIGLAHGLRLRVVSEGVESESQANALCLFDCDELQGYLLGRPESAAAASGRLLAEVRADVEAA